ncbi:hypothetical protein LX36DRAFT_215464 [Colletotrichum falcatum]|nr:hypothetical protein LX36DRAFT_215464 [Colletotrichum falcatum]
MEGKGYADNGPFVPNKNGTPCCNWWSAGYLAKPWAAMPDSRHACGFLVSLDTGLTGREERECGLGGPRYRQGVCCQDVASVKDKIVYTISVCLSIPTYSYLPRQGEFASPFTDTSSSPPSGCWGSQAPLSFVVLGSSVFVRDLDLDSFQLFCFAPLLAVGFDRALG